MAKRGHLRASDGDREHVADRLRHATAEGRLSTAELEHRLTAALSARTYAELDAVLADLPGKSLARRQPQAADLVAIVRPAIAVAIAVPVAAALIAVVAVLATGMFALWLLWVALGWWFFGRRHHHHRGSRHRARRYRAPQRYSTAQHYPAPHGRRGGSWL